MGVVSWGEGEVWNGGVGDGGAVDGNGKGGVADGEGQDGGVGDCDGAVGVGSVGEGGVELEGKGVDGESFESVEAWRGMSVRLPSCNTSDGDWIDVLTLRLYRLIVIHINGR